MTTGKLAVLVFGGILAVAVTWQLVLATQIANRMPAR